jgi:DNA helicase-2/ATP-dependent DNA helicase PcrA
LDEIPRNFLNYIKNPNRDSVTTSFEEVKSSTQKITSNSKESKYAIGQVVNHAKFGMGTIVNYEGSGDSMRLQIKFKKVGTKWLISSYAKLEII